MCKNNYNVYTTDYDPDNEHMDRMAMDVMDTQKVLDEIKRLESRMQRPWTWTEDDRATEGQVLRELKKELGIPNEVTGKDLESLDVKTAVHDAVKTHAQPDHSNAGFTKAYGLES